MSVGDGLANARLYNVLAFLLISDGDGKPVVTVKS